MDACPLPILFLWIALVMAKRMRTLKIMMNPFLNQHSQTIVLNNSTEQFPILRTGRSICLPSSSPSREWPFDERRGRPSSSPLSWVSSLIFDLWYNHKIMKHSAQNLSVLCSNYRITIKDNATKQCLKMEKKADRNFEFSFPVVFLICWMPFFTLNMIKIYMLFMDSWSEHYEVGSGSGNGFRFLGHPWLSWYHWYQDFLFGSLNELYFALLYFLSIDRPTSPFIVAREGFPFRAEKHCIKWSSNLNYPEGEASLLDSQ